MSVKAYNRFMTAMSVIFVLGSVVVFGSMFIA